MQKPEIIATFKPTAMVIAVARALKCPVYIYVVVSFKEGKKGKVIMQRVPI